MEGVERMRAKGNGYEKGRRGGEKGHGGKNKNQAKGKGQRNTACLREEREKRGLEKRMSLREGVRT